MTVLLRFFLECCAL